MIKIKFSNLSRKAKPAGLDWEKWLKKTMRLLKGNKKLLEQGNLDLCFVDTAQIKALNHDYRNVDRETDVLSFSFIEGESYPGEDLVGQIFLCPQIAQKQAKTHNVSYREECEFLLVHAFLHVFGYDHEKPAEFRKMFKLQLKLFPQAKWQDYVRLIFLESFPR